MARVTIEDCILQVPNRFDLVVLAARRSRDLGSGLPLTIERDNDKNPIVALREIAGGHVGADKISESVVQNLQRVVEIDDAEEATAELGMPALEALSDLSLPEDMTSEDMTSEDMASEDTIPEDDATPEDMIAAEEGVDDTVAAQDMPEQDANTPPEAQAEDPSL